MTAFAETVRHQRMAADPLNSAFVMANAGAGKTRVLTNRVIRLLLDGNDPRQILCITFTKAAAAEMADRLFETLGAWSLMADDDLNTQLEKLEGDTFCERDGAALMGVRRLFACALETPGGLKIQTIHSFCESILRRFPIEAGLAPGFTVLEDAEAQAILQDQLDRMARRADKGATSAADLFRLAAFRGEDDLRALLIAEAQAGLKHDAIKLRYGSVKAAIAALASRCDLDVNADPAHIREAFIAAIDPDFLAASRDVLLTGTKTSLDRAASIESYFAASTINEQWSALSSLFLTQSGLARKDIFVKALREAHPALSDRLDKEKSNFASVVQKCAIAETFQNSAAFLRVVDDLREAYEAAKTARAVLDFDDLIITARRLLETETSAWVRYKLDAGIDHVLIDEAQDTSPEQWRVIEAVIADFLSGAGAREKLRTVFAVGDVKQSIYSFQGADAALFSEKELDLGKRLAAYHDEVDIGAFNNVNMQMSFRTTTPVLRFVDALFLEEAAREGMGASGVPAHLPFRDGEAGRVELWPLTPRHKPPEANAWDAPVDSPAPGDPSQALCARIVQRIRQWLDDGRILESLNRPIRPSDILILVQSRSRIFSDILRGLAKASIPVAGADRLKLDEDPAVEDLLSLARFCASPQDDLSLAEVLKSPLFGFDDDTDLFPIAHERKAGETLWDALLARSAERPHWDAVCAELKEAMHIAGNVGSYALFSFILDASGGVQETGRKRFYARLSEASRDALDEFLRQSLEYESRFPRSVSGFLAWFERTAVEIKREQDRDLDAVRVMTVHGSKGLEANIVFVIDADRPPNLKRIGLPLRLSAGGGEGARQGVLPVLAPSEKNDTDAIKDARANAKRNAYEEYRRQLYVAMTRARDELYIAGIERGRKSAQGVAGAGRESWHELAHRAFDALGDDVQTDEMPYWPDGDAPLRWMYAAQDKTVDAPVRDEIVAATEMPDCLLTPAPMESRQMRISPSRMADKSEGEQNELAVPCSPLYRDKYFRGRVLHRMLELLPRMPQGARAAAAERLIATLAPELADEESKRWRDEVLTILEDPEFGAVFDQSSRAEVSITGEINGKIVDGQIDRLCVRDGRVLIVDYKTNRPPPADVEDTPAPYLAQMAAYRALVQEIYPDHQIECALLWTFEARLASLPKSLLDKAFARWVANA